MQDYVEREDSCEIGYTRGARVRATDHFAQYIRSDIPLAAGAIPMATRLTLYGHMPTSKPSSIVDGRPVKTLSGTETTIRTRLGDSSV
jgi:hypothetical protein